MPKESDVQKAIMEWCKYKGFYCLRLNSGRLMARYNGKTRMISLCPAGTPDLFVIARGLHFFVEVKKDDKEVEKWVKKVESYKRTSYVPPSYKREIQQYKEHKKIVDADGVVLLVGSLKALEEDLKKLYERWGMGEM